MSDYVERIGSRGCGYSTSMDRGDAQRMGREHYRHRVIVVVRDMQRWKAENSEDNINFWYQDSLVIDIEAAKVDPVQAMSTIFTLATEAAKIAYNDETDLMKWKAIAAKRDEEPTGWVKEYIEKYTFPSPLYTKVQLLVNEIATHWMADSNGIFDDLWKPGGVPNLDHPVQKALWEGKI